uniref:Uncharacterized protein n=1 Tax=Rhizobium rhizogenes TaxID=359 RepID=A0A7S4ZS71_RHIRH|nr:hypothetical protein pC5.8d_714 [Rhizobium rhizogenes]
MSPVPVSLGFAVQLVPNLLAWNPDLLEVRAIQNWVPSNVRSYRIILVRV